MALTSWTWCCWRALMLVSLVALALGLAAQASVQQRSLPPLASFGEHVGGHLPLTDVERMINVLKDTSNIDVAIQSGRQMASFFFSQLHSLLYHYAVRAPHLLEAVQALHLAARLVEVLLPRAPLADRALLEEQHARIGRQLRKCIFAAEPMPKTALRSASLGGPGASDENAFADVVGAGHSRAGSARLSWPGSSNGLDVEATRLTVALTLMGADYGRAALPTLVSLLYHTPGPLEVVAVGDVEGFNALTNVLSGVNVSARGVILTFVELMSNPRYWEILQLMPEQCVDPSLQGLSRKVNRSVLQIGLARLFLHELLLDYDRVLAIDVGDLLVLGNLYSLWHIFEEFDPDDLFACAMETGQSMISFGAQRGDAVEFWRSRGFDDLAKGLNPGVLLMDLKRMRELNSNGASWTLILLLAAEQVSRMSCGLDSTPQIAVLNSIVFNGGDALMKELSSKWNYIPVVHWEHVAHAAQDAALPSEVLKSRLHPGLLPGGRFAHACPEYSALVGEWTLIANDDDELTRWHKKAKSYFETFTARRAPGLYTSDLACGDAIVIVHFAGYSKTQPWAKLLLRYWAQRFEPVAEPITLVP
eukprot:TRINITY_DN11417_c0_g2_i1.p1 TRINITY_DN11417_c0_g2~~TRINITY_DN11417_c0_g2_i1.p1  ORF type:complete len:629 (+),score=96.31 TRINITY_DN11417_c0_g2_i1:119-1888(+)